MKGESMNQPSALGTEKARELLQSYGAVHGVVDPPIPVNALAKWMGFQVVLLFSVGDEFSGLVSTKQKLIGINGNHHIHRQRFSLGHELAHILLKHPPESHCTAREIRLWNTEADFCASELLIPTDILRAYLRRSRNPARLARVFQVSEEAMKVKMGLPPLSSSSESSFVFQKV
jgi:Zn-dependent peptidase ImmA (M78 family)